jgi:hypothetical protein
MNFGCLGVSAVIDLRFFNDQNKKRKNSLMCCGGREHFPNGDNSELHVVGSCQDFRRRVGLRLYLMVKQTKKQK